MTEIWLVFLEDYETDYLKRIFWTKESAQEYADALSKIEKFSSYKVEKWHVND